MTDFGATIGLVLTLYVASPDAIVRGLGDRSFQVRQRHTAIVSLLAEYEDVKIQGADDPYYLSRHGLVFAGFYPGSSRMRFVRTKAFPIHSVFWKKLREAATNSNDAETRIRAQRIYERYELPDGTVTQLSDGRVP